MRKISLTIISIVISCAMVATPACAKQKALTEKSVMEIAEEVGDEYNICPELLASIAYTESRYEPDVERDGCIGLMQVSAKWHKDRMKELGVSDLRSPYENMLVAADYLAELFKEYEDPGLVLMIYNGDASAKKYQTGKSELSKYASDILEMSEKLERKHKK